MLRQPSVSSNCTPVAGWHAVFRAELSNRVSGIDVVRRVEPNDHRHRWQDSEKSEAVGD